MNELREFFDWQTIVVMIAIWYVVIAVTALAAGNGTKTTKVLRGLKVSTVTTLAWIVLSVIRWVAQGDYTEYANSQFAEPHIKLSFAEVLQHNFIMSQAILLVLGSVFTFIMICIKIYNPDSNKK